MPGFNALQSVTFVRIQVGFLQTRAPYALANNYLFMQGMSGVTSLDAFHSLTDLSIGIQIAVCFFQYPTLLL